MKFICHRVNTFSELELIQPEFGIELDLRDSQSGKIHIMHDPYVAGEDFEDYLSKYHHGLMILNIKSERIEFDVLKLIQKYNIQEYFFLDSTFPMIKSLIDHGEKNIALRFSEYEGMDILKMMKGQGRWVWVDCFTQFPLDYAKYLEIKNLGYKLCFVSPELQNQDSRIEEYATIINKEKIQFDAICTKSFNISRWEKLLTHLQP